MTVVEKGPYRGLRFPKRQIMAKPGRLRLQCGKCGGMDFEAHIVPDKTGKFAQIRELICLSCTEAREVDNRHYITRPGKVKAESLLCDYVAPPPNDLRALEVRKWNDEHKA